MKKVGVAILGLGVVGGGTYKILKEHRDFYRANHGIDITVEGVLEINRERALALGVEEEKIASNIAEICSNPEVDIVIEVMGGIEPAKTFVANTAMFWKKPQKRIIADCFSRQAALAACP